MSSAAFSRLLRQTIGSLLCAAALIGSSGAAAQPDARSKIAPDLLATIGSSALPEVPWARLLGGELLVRALVVASGDDPGLGALRRQVLALGGSVTYNYTSIRALAIMLPASRLLELAQTPEVLFFNLMTNTFAAPGAKRFMIFCVKIKCVRTTVLHKIQGFRKRKWY